MFVTKRAIEYKAAPYGLIATIPAGTPVSLASNLPEIGERPRYWAHGWTGMTDNERRWHYNYGFLLSGEEVEEK